MKKKKAPGETGASPKNNSGKVAAPHGQVKHSAATRLVDHVIGYDYFHDQQDRPFVKLTVNDHPEVWPVESAKFKKLLAGIYYKHTGDAINRNALGDAITTLAGRACHDSPQAPVFLRVAPHDDGILIDLCDEAWRVIKVTRDGWRILKQSPVAFVRTGSTQALPGPVHGSGSIDPLWLLLNVTKEERPLIAAALVTGFNPYGPYFVTNYVGEQGSAKSCAARIHRQLVDPNENPLRSPPREERDLLVQAASNHCVALDNLSRLADWLSDALCRIATGGGHSARSLYTDMEEISLAVKRPVIINGIEDVAIRPDLAERALQIELQTIPAWKRISERKLWADFEKYRPAIFSALLDALVVALRDYPEVELIELPRMADAAIWAMAAEPVFGWERGEFMAAYQKNLDEGAIASVEAHPVGVAILRLLVDRDEWSGEPMQLLKLLNATVSDEQRHAKDWPQNARSLSVCLRRLAPALRRAGIEVAYPPRKKRRMVTLCKAWNFASFATPATAIEGDRDDADDANDVSDDANIASDAHGGNDANDASVANLQPLHVLKKSDQNNEKLL